MQVKRILIVTPNSGLFGGTERVLEVLLGGSQHGFELAVAFLEDGPLVEIARLNGIAHVCIPRGRFRNPLSTLGVVRKLRLFIKESRPDVIFSWTDLAHIYSSMAGFGLVPCCWWQRSNVESGFLSMLCRMLPSLGAIPNSNFTKQQLLRRRIRVSDSVLYPPYDASRFYQLKESDAKAIRDSLRRRLKLPVGQMIVGSVGRLQGWKGFETIINALSILQKDGIELHCLLIGARHDLEPAYEKRLQSLINRLGFKDCVTLIGAQRDVTSWMLAMDIFVHAAEREPFGIVVPEAMAMGLPVIASIPGGPGEVITNGVDGLLVHSNSVEEMVKAIHALYSSKKLREELGRQAITKAEAFSSKGFTERLLNSLEEFL